MVHLLERVPSELQEQDDASGGSVSDRSRAVCSNIVRTGHDVYHEVDELHEAEGETANGALR